MRRGHGQLHVLSHCKTRPRPSHCQVRLRHQPVRSICENSPGLNQVYSRFLSCAFNVFSDIVHGACSSKDVASHPEFTTATPQGRIAHGTGSSHEPSQSQRRTGGHLVPFTLLTTADLPPEWQQPPSGQTIRNLSSALNVQIANLRTVVCFITPEDNIASQ